MSIDIVARAMAASAEGGEGTTYTAGDNITISADNVISATDTTYEAGDNITISADNVISATDTTYEAGDNITIEDNVISAISGGSSQLVEVFPDITTYEEITALLTDGKIPYIVEDRPDAGANWLKMLYIFNEKYQFDNSYFFYSIHIGGNSVCYYKCKSNNTWTNSSVDLAIRTDVSNKEYRLEAGTSNVTIDRSDFRAKTTISVAPDDTKQDKLTAGDNITIDSNNVISATGGTPELFICHYGTTKTEDIDNAVNNGLIPICIYNKRVYVYSGKTAVLTAYYFTSLQGSTNYYLTCSATNSWSNSSTALATTTNLNTKQNKLTAGDNITIEDNVISATGGAEYVAGNNITISDNVISAVDTTYTAGTNITIDSNNVISATGGTEYVAGENITIENGVISATDTTYEAGDNIIIEDNVISAIPDDTKQNKATASTTDIGVGATLADGEIYLVYEE